MVRVDPHVPEPEPIARAADRLRNGGLVAFPTETVYGLGAHAMDPHAVRRIFTAKGRPSNDPLIVHIAAVQMLAPLVVRIPAAVHSLTERFWPGPLTIILQRSHAVPDEVTAGLDTVAVRVPAHPVAHALLRAVSLPIAAPSANLFSRPSPTRAEHVLEDLADRIDMVVDGGPTAIGVESTVLDVSTDVPTILRPGAITSDMLRPFLPDLVVHDRNAAHDESHALPSPGMLSRHYAPRTPLSLFRGPSAADALLDEARKLLATGKRVVVLTVDEHVDGINRATPAASVVAIGSAAAPHAIAARLYAAVREADALGADSILMCDLSGSTGLEDALRDRLRRAAARIVGT